MGISKHLPTFVLIIVHHTPGMLCLIYIKSFCVFVMPAYMCYYNVKKTCTFASTYCTWLCLRIHDTYVTHLYDTDTLLLFHMDDCNPMPLSHRWVIKSSAWFSSRIPIQTSCPTWTVHYLIRIIYIYTIYIDILFMTHGWLCKSQYEISLADICLTDESLSIRMTYVYYCYDKWGKSPVWVNNSAYVLCIRYQLTHRR